MILGPFWPDGEAAKDRASSPEGLGAEPDLLFSELNCEAAVWELCRLPDLGGVGLSSPSACRPSVVEKCRGVLVGYWDIDDRETSKRQRPRADRTTDRFIEAVVEFVGLWTTCDGDAIVVDRKS